MKLINMLRFNFFLVYKELFSFVVGYAVKNDNDFETSTNEISTKDKIEPQTILIYVTNLARSCYAIINKCIQRTKKGTRMREYYLLGPNVLKQFKYLID